MTDLIRHPNREVEYPISDGKPMAESDLHRDQATYIIEALKQHFRTRRDVYVSGNNFIYWEEGNPRRVVSPDAYVVFGVEMYPRDCYMAWKEGGEGGKRPDVVFEFTSRKTRREDTDRKRPLYEQELQVPEYFLFDPRGEYLKPRLQGFRLQEGTYVPLEVVDGRLHSRMLGLDLVQKDESLRLFDPRTGEWLPSVDDLQDRARSSAAELGELRAELEALRAQLRQKDT